MQKAGASARAARVFVVDDDAAMRVLFGRIITAEGHEPVVFDAPMPALHALQAGVTVDLLLTDLDLGTNMTGADLAREARVICPGLPVLLVTGESDIPLSLDVTATVGKPFRLHELAAALRRCLISP